MSNLPDADRAILARLMPQVQRLKDNPAGLGAWVVTLNPQEITVLFAWAQHQAAWLLPALGNIDAAYKRIDALLGP